MKQEDKKPIVKKDSPVKIDRAQLEAMKAEKEKKLKSNQIIHKDGKDNH